MAGISVFGLGYVGCVGVGCLAKLGHAVIGCDVNVHKVNQIARGIPTIVERGVDSLIAEGHAAGRITATLSAEEAVLKSEISFICVGTPATETGGLDLSFIMTVVKEIGLALKMKTSFHVVVLRSTVSPGTNERITKVLEEVSGKKVGVNFAVVSNPEFLREGIAIADFMSPPITVLGSEDPKALAKLRAIYEPLNSEIVEVPPKVAEMIKFVNNSYHALKVTFGNEIGAICKKLSIDSHQVMDLFCRDKQLNISPVYFKPGFAYGGSCLPKDLKGLNYLASSNCVETPLLESIDASNAIHIRRVVEQVHQIGTRSVGLIGLTFKAGTDDLRNSAAVILAEALLGKGISLKIYDRYLNIALEKDPNNDQLNARIPHLRPLLQPSVNDVVTTSKLVIITVKSPDLPNLIRENPNVHFLDLVRVKDESVFKEPNYEGFCW